MVEPVWEPSEEKNQLSIEVCGETLSLLSEKAVHWLRQRTLLIADCHFGKSATLRSHFIAVPRGSTDHDLARLSRLLLHTRAERLVFLGDLLDSRTSRRPEIFDRVRRWRRRHRELEVVVVRGNHDQRAGDAPRAWAWTYLDEPFDEPPFCFRHYPQPVQDRFVLGGHIHPAVRMTGLGKQSERLPCFLFDDEVGILPAFGSLTGTHLVKPRPGSQVYVVAPGLVRQMN